LHDYDVFSPEEWKIKLRIGIHLGDVVRREGDIFGDAVNIASRIQPLADPEGVCVSEQIYYQIRNKLSYSFEQLDRPELKNVNFPTNVYKVIMLWQKKQNDQESVLAKVSSLDKKRIAVLPFSNISPDPNDEYFADGMTEELISTIAKIARLQVIARTSILRYKSGNMSVVEIGKELKAGTILEGSVRKAGDKLRITAQLIDSQGSQHLWSESYDRELKDVFAIQTDISKTVANALKVQLLSSEKRDIEKRATESTEAHTMYLKGLHQYNERTKEGNERAVKYFEEAIKLDPKYAIAYAALADCYSIFGDYGWLNPGQAYPKAKLFAAKAIETDPTLAEAHASLGLAVSSDWNLIGAETEYKKAIELKPGYATAYLRYGLLLEFMRR
jgi:adenylate cyclase